MLIKNDDDGVYTYKKQKKNIILYYVNTGRIWMENKNSIKAIIPVEYKALSITAYN